MFNLLSYKISDFFIANGKIALEKRDVFAYGISRLFTNAILLVSFVLIGWLMRDIKSVFIFLLFFIPLRKYAGGFHFQSNICCYIVSCLVVVIVIFSIRIVNDIKINWVLSIISLIVLICLSPVQDYRKKLTFNERIEYKIKVKAILSIEICINLFLYECYEYSICFLFTMVLFIESVLLLVGKIKNIIYNNSI